MKPLPAPLADPLHVLPPAILPALRSLASMALVLLAFYVLGLLVRRRIGAPAPPAALPRPAAGVEAPAASIGDRISAIERKFTRSKHFRDGCHALAAAVKQHLEQVTGLGVEEMTSAELAETFERGVQAGARRVGGPQIGRFMIRLSGRRYGRDEPRRRHFVEACGKAKELLK